jgi:prepilin-type N-terminal cleavage/methylation domain-containing protein
MKGEMTHRMNNKGFSLVELIIVVAIMAVLVGVVGTQVIPYMENARRAKDVQILSAYATAGVMAYAANADLAPTSGTMEILVSSSGTEDIFTCDIDDAQRIANNLKELIGTDYLTQATKLFHSKTYRPINKIQIVYDFNDRTIKVYAIDGSNAIINANENIYGTL